MEFTYSNLIKGRLLGPSVMVRDKNNFWLRFEAENTVKISLHNKIDFFEITKARVKIRLENPA